jgi:hypothetical protein
MKCFLLLWSALIKVLRLFSFLRFSALQLSDVMKQIWGSAMLSNWRGHDRRAVAPQTAYLSMNASAVLAFIDKSSGGCYTTA